MEKWIKKFERIVVIGLLAMMVVVVFLSTIELGVILVTQMVEPPRYILLDINDLLKIFGFFLMILIGLELVETLKVYFVEGMVHVEIVFLVAIIAVARKVIILDFKKMDPLSLIGIACIIISLSGGYYILKKVLDEKKE